MTDTSRLKQRPGDQPLPTQNDHPDIQSQVIADIQARREIGIQRYGTALQPFNGRDALRDLYEELIDATMYIRQLMTERASQGTTDLADKVQQQQKLLLEILSSFDDHGHPGTPCRRTHWIRDPMLAEWWRRADLEPR